MRRALSVCAVLAGCAPARPATPDRHELANILPGNIVPKSSPAQLARTFETFCLNGPRDFAAAERALRQAVYVPLPSQGRGITGFVVDDKRPMVLVSSDGRSCGVGAQSHTGQTERIRTLVAKRFPTARPVDASRFGQDLEQAWQVPGTGILFLQRMGQPNSPSRLVFGIWRTT